MTNRPESDPMSEESEDKVWLQIDHEVTKLRVNCALRDLQGKIAPAQHGSFAGEEAYWLEMLRRQVDFVEQFLPKLYEIYSSEWTERKPADFYRVVYRRAVKQALTNAQTGFEKYVDALTPKDLDGAPLLSVLPRFLPPPRMRRSSFVAPARPENFSKLPEEERNAWYEEREAAERAHQDEQFWLAPRYVTEVYKQTLAKLGSEWHAKLEIQAKTAERETRAIPRQPTNTAPHAGSVKYSRKAKPDPIREAIRGIKQSLPGATQEVICREMEKLAAQRPELRVDRRWPTARHSGARTWLNDLRSDHDSSRVKTLISRA